MIAYYGIVVLLQLERRSSLAVIMMNVVTIT